MSLEATQETSDFSGKLVDVDIEKEVRDDGKGIEATGRSTVKRGTSARHQYIPIDESIHEGLETGRSQSNSTAKCTLNIAGPAALSMCVGRASASYSARREQWPLELQLQCCSGPSKSMHGVFREFHQEASSPWLSGVLKPKANNVISGETNDVNDSKEKENAMKHSNFNFTMGNSLSATTPAEIMPVEFYINDFVEQDSIERLGSTRFMKVARGRTNENGLQVLKVFVFPAADPSQLTADPSQIEAHCAVILQIRDALINTANCCTVKKILKKAKYAVSCRPYQKYTLFDRLSTRPFVVETERLWYMYQLFKALLQCEESKICHGDIKSENILISSSNWLQLTDFASFKPAFLPVDNPSNYTYYFDTSRRQTCYIAPERFLGSEEYSRQEGRFLQYECLRHSMDMFSTGCVIYEMVCDGQAPFSYGGLCMYRAMGPAEAAQFLDTLLAPVSSPLRPLLRILLAREPNLRPTASKVLAEFSHLFPPVFEVFLYNYLNVFRSKEVSNLNSVSIEDIDVNHRSISCFEPDDIIERISSDMKTVIWPQITAQENSKQASVLFIGLITSNFRALRAIPIKIEAMRLLLEFSKLTNSSIAIDRILPFLVHAALMDNEATVRGRAILSITTLLAAFEPTTQEEAAVFMDYLLPKFDTIAQDTTRPDSAVHMTLATCLGKIAETANRYMITSRSLQQESVDDETSGAEVINDANQHDREALALFKAIAGIFVHLCSRGNEIKQCVVDRESLEKLHVFTDSIKDSDSGFPLQHMVTFFNIKQDWRLRAVFFDALPHCVIHKKSVDILHALLNQGVIEYEEMVVVRAIHCIGLLSDRDLLEKESVQKLFFVLTPFLSHPNEWIRGAVVDFLIVLDSKWTLAEIHCRVLQHIDEYLTRKMLRLNNKTSIITSLKEPIPRAVWSQVMDLDEKRVEEFCKILNDLKVQRLIGNFKVSDPVLSRILNGNSIDKDESLLRRLANFSSLFPEMVRSRIASSMETRVTQYNGVIDLASDSNLRVEKHEHVLGDKIELSTRSQVIVEPRQIDHFSVNDAPRMRSIRDTVCDAAVRELLEHKNDQFRKTIGRPRPGSTTKQWHNSPNHGTLVAHLHEHSERINELAVQPTGDRFASASSDGSIKIWNAKLFNGDAATATKCEGKCSYSKNHKILSAGWACDGQLLCFSASDRRIIWADVSSGNNIKICGKVEFESEVGAAEQIYVSGQLAFARTHHGYFYLLDYRMPNQGSLGRHVVWRRQLPNNHGLATSFTIDPERENWMVVSTTNYVLSLWDLRYPIEVKTWQTTEDKEARLPLKVWALPNQMQHAQEGPEVFVGYMHRGHFDSYEVHSGLRKRVFWPSLSEPLNYNATREIDNDRNVATTSMAFCPESGFIYTGDSIGALRRWSLDNITACEYLSGPHRPTGEFLRQRIVFDMSMQAMDGEERRYFEKAAPIDRLAIDRTKSPLETKVTSAHRTAITSLCTLPGNLLASASHDGIVKIWNFIVRQPVAYDSVMLTVFVMLSDSDQAVREAVRSTWASPGASKYLKHGLIQVIFVVGSSDHSLTDSDHDVLQVSVKEEYRNLLYKELIAYKWILDSQRNGFVLKIDGLDTVVNLDRLFTQIAINTEEDGIFCQLTPPKRVKRNPVDKWYISSDNYKDETFPEYCSGPSYMISMKSLREIVTQTRFHQPIFIEDIFYTGILAQSAGVSIRNSANIFAINCPEHRTRNHFHLQCNHEGKVETSVISAHCFQNDLSSLWRLLQRETCQRKARRLRFRSLPDN
ncbi:unnamed protein product, partial [Mesorhabditis belari]|uniref:non-specific serine/threonine protein kinase n=1 Tax=Mesorhabditis belari TaxID=2138241 RepID=A0AAF3EXT5_9BILA